MDLLQVNKKEYLRRWRKANQDHLRDYGRCYREAHRKPRRTPFEKFNARWIPEPLSGCWLWTGKLHFGYGRFSGVSKKDERAHRAAWILYKGAIPEGLCVLHHCDVRSCVNPDHLFIGTKLDNTRDCIAKGRFNPGHQKGEINGRSKLTAQQVYDIRASALGCLRLSRQFGVSTTTIKHIRNRRLWTHI